MKTDFILNQELPDFEEALRRAKSSLQTSSASQQSCCCPHLQRYLPAGFLDSKNPVHALHLDSQLDGSPILYGEEHERWLAVTATGFPVSFHSFINPITNANANKNTPTPKPANQLPSTTTSAAVPKLSSETTSNAAVAIPAINAKQAPAEVRKQQTDPALKQPKDQPPLEIKRDAIEKPQAFQSVGAAVPAPEASERKTTDTAESKLSTATAANDPSPSLKDAADEKSSHKLVNSAPAKNTVNENSAENQVGAAQAKTTADEKSAENAPVDSAPAKNTVNEKSAENEVGAAQAKSTADEKSSKNAPIDSAPAKNTVNEKSVENEVGAAQAKSTADEKSAENAPVDSAPAKNTVHEKSTENEVGAAPAKTTADEKSSGNVPVDSAPAKNTVDEKSAENEVGAAQGKTTAGEKSSENVVVGSATANKSVDEKPANKVTSAPTKNTDKKIDEVASNDARDEAKFLSLFASEDQIRTLRRDFLSKRVAKKDNKKRKLVSLQSAPAWKLHPGELTHDPPVDELYNKEQQQQADRMAKIWMEHFRQSRICYWMEKKQVVQPKIAVGTTLSTIRPGHVFGSFSHGSGSRLCQLCVSDPMAAAWNDEDVNPNASGDELFQCLECSAPASCRSHAVQHFLQKNHSLAVSCGRLARLYCFKCSDFVYHPAFDQEKERIDLAHRIPSMAWKAHSIQRSFDALQFVQVPDQGIFWRGMKAVYPPLVPPQHAQAAKLCRQRQIVLHGEVDELSPSSSHQTKKLTSAQHLLGPNECWKICAPVGMYNLGNTCFMSAILQCLIHCEPMQHYFLRAGRHNHEACAVYRKMYGHKLFESSTAKGTKKKHEVCIACEMDKLFLHYVSSTRAVDVLSAMRLQIDRDVYDRREQSSTPNGGRRMQGDPLITADMLAAAWKCGGMNHLAGYEQRDAHEFLHSFLEMLGKHARVHRVQVAKAINTARPNNSTSDSNEKEQDEIKNIFEGSLRSVLVCSNCGSKRVQSEKFMSISLPLSNEVRPELRDVPSSSSPASEKLTVEHCLRHFTMPELLSDNVDCPSCGKKTPTKKQHVVSKLPKVLVLHLKRFDSAASKKIEDFVAFPSKGLNMGPYLPHWCEVSRVPSLNEITADASAIPNITYDLYATVNHFGTLQSGHYVSNLKVKDTWYHCNDSHVGYAGAGSGEQAVLQSQGAYLLFYIRK